MPGLNRQGPDGNGPMSGRQLGMCRRTEELLLKGARAGQGRGMGGRCRGTYFQDSGGRRPMAVVRTNEDVQDNAEELSTLKAEYKKTQAMLESLMQKIEMMQGEKR
jgi:hypothetical protein